MAKRVRGLVPLALPDDCVALVATMVYRHHSQDLPNIVAVLLAMGSRDVWTVAANALLLKDPHSIQSRAAFRCAFLNFHQEVLANQRSAAHWLHLLGDPMGSLANIAGPVPRPVFYGMVLRAPVQVDDVVSTYYIVTRVQKIANTYATLEMRELERRWQPRHLVQMNFARAKPHPYARLKLPKNGELPPWVLDIPDAMEAQYVRLADRLSVAPFRL